VIHWLEITLFETLVYAITLMLLRLLSIEIRCDTQYTGLCCYHLFVVCDSISNLFYAATICCLLILLLVFFFFLSYCSCLYFIGCL
jgi:hypothetical protein